MTIGNIADDERTVAIEDLLKEHLKSMAAIDFIQAVCRIIAFIDDIEDQDRQPTTAECREIIYYALVDLPLNQFFVDHRATLTTMLLTAIDSWQVATELERTAREETLLRKQMGQKPEIHPNLYKTYELRETIYQVAPICVQLVHGREARERFSTEWFRLTRSYEPFEDYAQKITASKRPKKLT